MAEIDIEKLAREAGLIEPRDVWGDLPGEYRAAISALAALLLKDMADEVETYLHTDKAAARLRAISRELE